MDYFDADDVQEDKKDEEKFIPKPYVGKSGAKSAKKDNAKKEPRPTPKPKYNSNVDGQISLLGETV